MFYIIQRNTFKEEGWDSLIDAMWKLDLGFETVNVLPFTDEIEYQTRRKDIFVFGCMKLARIAKNKNWVPGSLMDEKHDFLHYRNLYQEHLLNFDSKIYQFKEDFPWDDLVYFIRPCKDTKAFNGDTYDVIRWSKFRHEALASPESFSSQLTPDTLIQVASTKRTMKEFRFWIVNGKIVTGSQYKQGFRHHQNGIIDQGAIDFCEEMLKLGLIAKAFVMDVALVNDSYKIIECGCINCAGFYKADMQRVVAALEECDWHDE